MQQPPEVIEDAQSRYERLYGPQSCQTLLDIAHWQLRLLSFQHDASIRQSRRSVAKWLVRLEPTRWPYSGLSAWLRLLHQCMSASTTHTTPTDVDLPPNWDDRL